MGTIAPAEDPELVRAAASATVLAVQNGNLEGELRDSQVRILEAGDAERRRLERDLHDSARQRLVALRIHRSLASEELDGSEQQAIVDMLGSEVDEAIDDLRSIATGLYPKILGDAGVGAALRSVSVHARSRSSSTTAGAVGTRRRSSWPCTSRVWRRSRTRPSTPDPARPRRSS